MSRQSPSWPRTVALAAALASLLAAAPAVAQDVEIVGFDLTSLDTRPPGTRLVARTNTGAGIPADRIDFKVKGHVVRVTYKDVPLAKDLGIKVDLANSSPHIEKAYAVAETETQAFVRLRFDADADLALKGHAIYPGHGGITIDFPFGATSNEPLPDEPPHDDNTNNTNNANNAEPDLAANHDEDAGAVAPPEPDAEPAEPGDHATDKPTPDDGDDEARHSGTPAPPPDTTAPPTPPPSTPTPPGSSAFNLDDPVGPLAVMLLAFLSILALLAVWAWLRSRKDDAPADLVTPEGALAPSDVQLLARYSLGEKSELLVVRVLGEVFVIGNGPLTLLRRMSAENQGDVWGAVDDVQHKLRSLLLQMQATYQPDQMPQDEVGSIVEKLDDDGQTIDFQAELRKRQQQADPPGDEQDVEQG